MSSNARKAQAVRGRQERGVSVYATQHGLDSDALTALMILLAGYLDYP